MGVSDSSSEDHPPPKRAQREVRLWSLPGEIVPPGPREAVERAHRGPPLQSLAEPRRSRAVRILLLQRGHCLTGLRHEVILQVELDLDNAIFQICRDRRFHRYRKRSSDPGRDVAVGYHFFYDPL